MSRDWTPREWDEVHREMPQLDPLNGNIYFVNPDGTKEPLYNQEQLDNFKTFPHLRLCGLNFLMQCRECGITNDEAGVSILFKIEGILSGIGLDDRELVEMTQLWYEGQLSPGYYMNQNNEVFIEYLKNRLKSEGD